MGDSSRATEKTKKKENIVYLRIHGQPYHVVENGRRKVD